MRLTKEEKEALLELVDVMTDRCPLVRIDMFFTPRYTMVFWSILKKLRLEVRGF